MCLRTFLGVFVFVVVVTLLMFLFVLLLPFKRLRIRVANEVGAALALFVVWLLNVKIHLRISLRQNKSLVFLWGIIHQL